MKTSRWSMFEQDVETVLIKGFLEVLRENNPLLRNADGSMVNAGPRCYDYAIYFERQ